MVDKYNFNNKVVIITGSAQGMGKAVAKKFGEYGAKIVINDISENSLKLTENEFVKYGFNVLALTGDVTQSGDVENIVNQTIERYGQVDILVNNAGVLKPTKVVEIDEKEWDFVVGVNLKGTFLFSKAVIPIMRSHNWGRIINFSSSAGKNISTVGGAHYTAAKAGILGFTRHLAKEAAEYGITVNSVCPGLIDTEMVRSTIDDTRAQAYADSFPINRLGTREEVADLVIFLASENASYITGASIDINGGDLMI